MLQKLKKNYSDLPIFTTHHCIHLLLFFPISSLIHFQACVIKQSLFEPAYLCRKYEKNEKLETTYES